MPMKKGTLVNNSYICQLILILTTLSCCAACPLFKCKILEGSSKESRIYSRSNISNSEKFYQFL